MPNRPAGSTPDPADGAVVAFPQSDPWDEWAGDLAEGTLALDGRCLRLTADWP